MNWQQLATPRDPPEPYRDNLWWAQNDYFCRQISDEEFIDWLDDIFDAMGVIVYEFNSRGS